MGCTIIATDLGKPGKKMEQLHLNIALHVPKLESNLLSIVELSNSGYTTLFNDVTCEIMKGDDAIAEASLEDGLFVLNGSYIPVEKANVTIIYYAQKRVDLWHQRLGHVNTRTVENMMNAQSVYGMSKDDVCEQGKSYWNCIIGKMTTSIMKLRYKNASGPGAIIYSDVCAPMSVQSIGKARYFVTFSHSYSNHKYLKVIYKKSDVLGIFKQYHRWFETQFRFKVKILYSDHGGEYEALKAYV